MVADFYQWLDTTATDWWYDSAVLSAIPGVVADGCVGVTTNPLLLRRALTGRPQEFAEMVQAVRPAAPGDARVVAFMQAVLPTIAAHLRPAYDASDGRVGYVCSQVNPRFAGDAAAMWEQARAIHTWAPNLAIKLPATAAGLAVMERCVGLGITTVITIGFSYAQSVAVARRYDAAVAAVRAPAPATQPGRCFTVLMVGRLNEFLADVALDHGSDVGPDDLSQAGTAVSQKIARWLEANGSQAALMASGFRDTRQVTALIGRNVHLSIGPDILANLVAAGAGVPGPDVAPETIARLRTIREFRQAYDDDGLDETEFIGYGAVQRTLTQFEWDGWRSMADRLDQA